MKNTQALFYTVLILLSATLTKAAAEGTGDDQSHAPGKRAAKRLRSDGEEISLPISAAANLDRESDGDSDYNPDSDNPSFPKAGKKPRRGFTAAASSGETSSSSSSSSSSSAGPAAAASAAGSIASDDDASHPRVLTFEKEGRAIKLFYGKEYLVSVYGHNRNRVSEAFRSLLNRFSEGCMQEGEREEIIKIFMERFVNVDLRLVFSKIFGRRETPLVPVLPFMEAVRRGDADLESALTKEPGSPFGRLLEGVREIGRNPHQMFAITYQARAWKDAMSEEAYRVQIAEPFERIFGCSPDEVIGTKEEPLVLSPAETLAVYNARKHSIDTTLRGFSAYLDSFHKVIAARSAAGQAGAAAAAAAGAIGLTPSLSASITEDNASTGSDVIGFLTDDLPGLFDD